MRPTYVLGLDLGTSAVKALLLPVEGAGEQHEATAGYPVSTPRPGWSEQNPEHWWQGVQTATQQVLTLAGAAAEQVGAVALSGQMHGATLLDAHGAVLRPCILWNDQRSAPQCAEIEARIGRERLVEWVGNPALAGFTAPKLVWVREHEPEVWARTRTVLLPKDYVNLRFTGQVATEPSDASGTLLFDVVRRTWSNDVLAALDLDARLLPPVHESAAPVGAVSVEAAEVTGLRAGTPVMAGGADNACAAIGSGVVQTGDALVSLGTSGTVVAPGGEPRRDPSGRLHLFCHALPNTWYLMGVVLSAGGSLQWYRDVIGRPEAAAAAEQGLNPYHTIMAGASTVPPGSEGLLFLPYLTGERTPHGDPDARGVFVGLSPRHTRNHMARSVIEGVCFALADSAAIMRALGVDLAGVRVTGGGASSPLWLQILADVLDTVVHVVRSASGPALGAAILAGVGMGAFSSVRDGAAHLVSVGECMAPDPERVRLYRALHQGYDTLYPSLAEHFRRQARLTSGV